MKIGRNEKCPCGSGKKYKKCHLLLGYIPQVTKIESTPEIEAMREQVEREHEDRRKKLEPLGIFVDFVKPVEFQGGKVWALGSRIYPKRPLNQTFHEFIISILYQTIGEEWRKEQSQLPESERHFIYRCSVKYGEWRRKNSLPSNQIGEVWAALPDGWSRSLVSLAFDICSLEHTEHIPQPILNRLKNRDQY